MEILLWLVPAALATALAMAWAGWAGRDGRGEIDRDEAVARLGTALGREHPGRAFDRPVTPRERSTGIAVRRTRTPD